MSRGLPRAVAIVIRFVANTAGSPSIRPRACACAICEGSAAAKTEAGAPSRSWKSKVGVPAKCSEIGELVAVFSKALLSAPKTSVRDEAANTIVRAPSPEPHVAHRSARASVNGRSGENIGGRELKARSARLASAPLDQLGLRATKAYPWQTVSSFVSLDARKKKVWIAAVKGIKSTLLQRERMTLPSLCREVAPKAVSYTHLTLPTIYSV